MLGRVAGRSAAAAEVGDGVGELLFGSGELNDALAFQHRAHERAEHPVAGNGGRHLNLVAATDPDGGGKLRGYAAEPLVAPVLGRTGFAGNRLAVVDGSATAGAAGYNALHNIGGGLGQRRVEHLFAGGVGLVDNVAVGILDGLDADCLVLGAAVGDGGIGLGHLAHGNLFGAKGDGRIGVQRGFDAALLGHIDHLVGADLGAQLGKAGVGGNGEGAGDGTGAVIGAAVVFNLPAVQGNAGSAVQVGFGRNAGVQCGKQGEGLERRAGLALCLRCQVVLVAVVIAAADERLDVAGVRIYRNHGQLKVAGKRFQLGVGGLFGGILDFRVDRGGNHHAALEHLVGGIVLQQLLAHVAGEVLVLVHAVARAYRRNVQVQLFRLGGIVLFLGDNAVGKHAVEHQVAALLAVVGVVDGVVVGRALRNADKRGGLGQGKVLGVHGIVALGRGLDAVGALTVVDGVQVHLQDVLLGVDFLQLDGDVRLAHLALQGRFLRFISQDGVAHELLRDGGSAFAAGMRHIHPHRTGNAHKVDAVVLVEALVFRGNGALGNVVAHLAELDGVAVL